MSWCFFFKQKTAYGMLRSLVGSEMCIRDRRGRVVAGHVRQAESDARGQRLPGFVGHAELEDSGRCARTRGIVRHEGRKSRQPNPARRLFPAVVERAARELRGVACLRHRSHAVSPVGGQYAGVGAPRVRAGVKGKERVFELLPKLLVPPVAEELPVVKETVVADFHRARAQSAERNPRVLFWGFAPRTALLCVQLDRGARDACRHHSRARLQKRPA